MIAEFQGIYRWLSNFHPVDVIFGREIYPSVEHAYQAAKTLDLKMREEIRFALTPRKAKRLGRKMPIRSDWEECKLSVMEGLVRQKFLGDSRRSKDLRERLIATGDQHIEEGNRWHDNYWGSCACPDCIDTFGQNYMGRILMKIREGLVQ